MYTRPNKTFRIIILLYYNIIHTIRSLYTIRYQSNKIENKYFILLNAVFINKRYLVYTLKKLIGIHILIILLNLRGMVILFNIINYKESHLKFKDIYKKSISVIRSDIFSNLH